MRKVLIVDDNEMNRLVAATILQNYDVITLEAENGNEAVEKCLNERPDIVLMDLQMPELNGIEATLEIRGEDKNVPIIALTANAIKGEDEKCYAAGMNDYISKPFKEEELLQKIIKWIKSSNISGGTENVVDDIRIERNEDQQYSLKSLEKISQGNQVFVNKMVRLFCDMTPELINEMIAAYKREDLDQMKKLALKIKPSIDNLEIKAISKEIRIVEKGVTEEFSYLDLASILYKIETTILSVTHDLQTTFLDK